MKNAKSEVEYRKPDQSMPESPQLSSRLSTSEHDQAHVDLDPECYSQLCMEPLNREGERPVSLVSTLSSGSSHDSRSLFGSTVALPSSTTPPIPSEEDIDLELSPAESTRKQTEERSPTLQGSGSCWWEPLEPRVINNQWNNNSRATSNRKASGEIPHISTSPVITDTMAPNPKLTYVDRVVMEIIETERMYVKDLHSIVEDYLAHIIDMSNLPIQPEQVCALFGNIDDIYEFNRLFETHPECKDVFFLFRDVEDLERLRTNRELRAHGLRVMSFIEKSVARLNQLERLEALALELGKSHYNYNAPPKYYSYVGAEFIISVQPILKERWTAELEEAWKTMFQYVTSLMNQGYQEESARQHHLALSPKDRPEKNNTAL
uniref:Uncharacterized protein n=1 Tax=Monopterus albus TaxID=43700 RepID=A0A3Q3ITR6_MONAL